MANTDVIDYRRTDVRANTLWNPYWITSGEIDADDCEDKTAIVFSFPAAKYANAILIEKIAIQVTEAIAGAGAAAADVGSFTLATDIVTTGGVCAEVDQDEYIPNADITVATPATYFAATGDWITAKLLMTELTPVIIVPADATVPCIGVYLTDGAGTMTGGKARVHVFITEVPTV